MKDWLVEGMQVDLALYDGQVVQFGLKSGIIEQDVAFSMTSSSGAAKNSVGGGCTKRIVRLSNGLTKPGPHYLKIGDKVTIDAKTQAIVKRV